MGGMSGRLAFLSVALTRALLAADGGTPPRKPMSPAPPPTTPAAATAAQAPRLSTGAQRNENVAVYQIDNDAIKEANIRLGTSTTIVPEAPVAASFYAAEHGRPPGEALLLRPAEKHTDWHGELFEMHQNGVFNARTFFQVGSVMPSHRNVYGGRFTGTVKHLGVLGGSFQQRSIRGMVNGNVLVPLPAERSSPAGDPRVRALIDRWLLAYPNILPNRPDFDPRALNTNAPQQIDEIDGSLRLDRDAGKNGRLTLLQGIKRQRTNAFQLVAGQNPNSEIHTLRSRLNYSRALSPGTEFVAGISFQRTKSVLVSEPNAVGPRVRFGYQIEELGPDSQYPVNRAQNTWRYGAAVTRTAAGGRHQISFGGDAYRYQLNGNEGNNERGQFQFGNNFGRSALENFLLGLPSSYETSIGDFWRGFRNWAADLYAADKIRISPRLQVYLGLRYSLESAPVEVNALDRIPYSCDCNNFSPRVAVAWQAGGGWVLRASYSVSFGRVEPVTLQQVRMDMPHIHYVIIQNPDILDPLRGVDTQHGRNSPTVLSPDLVGPYSHQYNFGIERKLANRFPLHIGYIGSRAFKMINVYTANRGLPVPGIPLTTATVDQRRADPRFYDIRMVVNGGIAYFDAAQATLDVPRSHGLTGRLSYTFSKAIDMGSDFAFTAANKDMLSGRSQGEFYALQDKKGLSNFDSTHAFTMSWTYDVPLLPTGRRAKWLLDGWQLSGVSLIKSGTPLTLFVGSDAPGFGNVDGGSGDRPNILDASILGTTLSNPDMAPLVLRRDRFAYVRPGDLRGDLGRNTLRKAGIANLNAAVTKQWRWPGPSERAVLFRAEAYNMTNKAQFDEPQRNLSSPAFGKITNTLNDGRVMQLVLRLIL